MSTDTERFTLALRTSLDLEGLHSGLEPDLVLARSRRSRSRRTAGMTLGGVAAVAAVAIAVVSVSGILRSPAALAPAGPTSGPVTSQAATATLAAGVTAASAVTGDGSVWSTGLTVRTAGRTDPVSLVAGTAADLSETTAATGVQVHRALRVVIGSSAATATTAVIAWADVQGPPSPTPHAPDPSAVTIYNVDPAVAVVVQRVMAGVVPTGLPSAHVVFFSADGMTDPTGAKVHAVEVPTFADPAGSGALLYLAVADTQVPLGQRVRGIFYVTNDGTFVDAEGSCALSRQACDGERPDGLDLKAELLRAIRP